MKICPRCQKTYTDENLNFCLEDGSVLARASQAQTVFVPNAQPTSPQSAQPPAWNVQPLPPYSMQPKKKSRAWVWALLVLGAVALLCGGGGLLLVVIGMQADDETNVAINTQNTNRANTATNTDTSGRSTVENINFSKWVPDSAKFAEVEYTDGELLVKNKEKSFYYVLAGTDKQRSVNADSRVTVRNVDNADTNLGYGIVFHSNPTPLQQGYALLIDSKKKRYRVVHHTPSEEEAVIDWTRSDAVLEGTQPNTLEVRDKPDKIELYINGKMVNSIKNQYGYPNGVVGIYSSGALRTAFKDLQLRH